MGRLQEVPGVFSQGQTLEELEANIQDAYELMRGPPDAPIQADAQLKEPGKGAGQSTGEQRCP